MQKPSDVPLTATGPGGDYKVGDDPNDSATAVVGNWRMTLYGFIFSLLVIALGTVFSFVLKNPENVMAGEFDWMRGVAAVVVPTGLAGAAILYITAPRKKQYATRTT